LAEDQQSEIIVVGARPRPLRDFYHAVLRLSWPATLALLAGGYLTANVVFALLYWELDGVANMRRGFLDAFFFSVQTMSTIGYGGLAPATRWANSLVTLQAILNIVLVALFTGITFAKFSRPTARVLFTDKAVVAMRDGVPHLCVRMANWRHNQVIEAQLRMYVVMVETTREGDTIRKPVELQLVRDRTPVFLLTFTAMHRIDASSPFFDKATREKMRADKVDLIMGFSGLDETLGQTIHARRAYTMDDIVWGAQFANVLTMLPDGTREIDYRVFHEIERQELPAGFGPSD